MVDRKNILDKAKKLKELANRGIGGEKVNAKEMFDKYVLKHKITKRELYYHNMSDEFKNMSREEFANIMILDLVEFGFEFLLNVVGGASNPIPKLKEGTLLFDFVNKYNIKG